MASTTSTPTFSLAYFEAVRDVQYHMMAAFGFLVWDVVMTFEDEVEYIWRMRRGMFKWLYFYFRYFLLAAQIFHVAVSPILSSGRTPDLLCMLWYQYAVLLAQLSLFLIDIVLVNRVYALFNRSRKVALVLVVLMLAEAGFAGSHIATFSKYTSYFEACMLASVEHDLARIHPAAIIIIQSIIISMLLFKLVMGMRRGWGRTPLVSFLLRDASQNYALVFLLSGIPLAFRGQDEKRIIAVFYWAITLDSSIGSRLILNMERYLRENPLDNEIELTSHISLY